MNARLVAVSALYRFQKDKAYSDALLKKTLDEANLSPRDAGLVARLYYGVLQNRAYLDFLLQDCSTVRLKKVHPRVLEIMRVGAYQLVFMDKIPAFSAVDESVKAAKQTGNARASGYVNAVLRSLSAKKEEGTLPEPVGETALERLSLRYSHPLPLVERLSRSLGEDLEAYLQADNDTVGTTIRVNYLRTDREALTQLLLEEGITVTPDPILDTCLHAEDGGNLTATHAYRQGLFSIQDKASMLACFALGAEPGDRIVDGCAAPGGKTLTLAEMSGNLATIYASDIYENKLEQIQINAGRLGINGVKTCLCDARKPLAELINQADRVLADVPCSGLGIIRKKPDIRYKDMADVDGLPPLQAEILDGLSACVKPGGVMLFSTCTVLKEENEAGAEAFLARHPDFRLEPFFMDLPPEYQAPSGMLTLYPHVHGTDGFFLCKLRRDQETK